MNGVRVRFRVRGGRRGRGVRLTESIVDSIVASSKAEQSVSHRPMWTVE